MEQKHRRAIQINFVKICDDLDGKHATRFLYSKEIISKDDKDEIRSAKTDGDLNEKLLDILPKQGPNAFDVFMEFLKENHVHLYQDLFSSLEELKTDLEKPHQVGLTEEAVSEMIEDRVAMHEAMLDAKIEAKVQSRFEDGMKIMKVAVRRMTDQPAPVERTRHEEVEDDKDGELPAPNVEEYSVVVAAGWAGERLRTVERYHPSKNSWRRLASLKLGRSSAFSFLYQDHLFVCGGRTDDGDTDTIERMNVVGNPLESWHDFPAKLPAKLHGYTCLVHAGKLIVIGGGDDKSVMSRCIYEMSLAPPYETRLITKMPRVLCYHCAVLIEDEVLICGGFTLGGDGYEPVDAVLLFNIEHKRLKELAPLSYKAARMAGVKRDDVVLLIGGYDGRNHLRRVMTYSIEEGPSMGEFPNMRYGRSACCAVAVSDSIIVMGGEDDENKDMSSVEVFSFDSGSWKSLPSMKGARFAATAVAW